MFKDIEILYTQPVQDKASRPQSLKTDIVGFWPVCGRLFNVNVSYIHTFIFRWYSCCRRERPDRTSPFIRSLQTSLNIIVCSYILYTVLIVHIYIYSLSALMSSFYTYDLMPCLEREKEYSLYEANSIVGFQLLCARICWTATGMVKTPFKI